MTALHHTLVLLCIVTVIVDPSNCTPIKRSTKDDCYGTDCYIDLDATDDSHNTQLLENITAILGPALPQAIDLLQNIGHTQQNVTTTALHSIVGLLDKQSENLDMQNEKLDRHNDLLENVTFILPQFTNMLQIQKDLQEQVTYLLQAHFDPGCISGLYTGENTILPPNIALGPFPVYCDMDTDGGGWIIFQRRFDGSVDFSWRYWEDYENGFGSLDGEFWLGLRKLHVLTSRGQFELMVNLEDFDGNRAYAHYDNFQVGNSSSFYRLTVGSYSGTAGDAMTYHNGMAFTTRDRDHDRAQTSNCAQRQQSGWWHNINTRANLNGRYFPWKHTENIGMTWYNWETSFKVLKKCELKIRPINP